MTSPWHLRQTKRCLLAGGVIAYPTEAVFGLGCDPQNQQAVQRLLAIKQRPWQKGLILIAADFTQLKPWLKPLSPLIEAKIQASWPGALTWILPAADTAPWWLRGQHQGLAVRVTAHAQTAALCRLWGGALVSTSANVAGHSAARTALQVRLQLKQQIDYIVSGATSGHQNSSQIRDALTDTCLRAGCL